MPLNVYFMKKDVFNHIPHINAFFETIVDPDQSAQLYFIIRICSGRILVRNILIKKANSLDPDQMAQIG